MEKIKVAPPALPIVARAPNSTITTIPSSRGNGPATTTSTDRLIQSASPPPPPSSSADIAASTSNTSVSPRRTSTPHATCRLNPSSFGQTTKHFSFEFFPPRTVEGTQNLMKRIETMGTLKPLYIDVTSNPKKRQDALEICAEALTYCGVNVMLHVVCTDETKEGVTTLLEEAKRKGIRNLMILRGDIPVTPPPANSSTSVEHHHLHAHPVHQQDFVRAADLIRFVRRQFGDWFCIACAGYPEGQDSKNPDSYQQDLRALKEKMEAGADFCVTQLFFDVELYSRFVKDCRDLGITIPIIPGIMPIQLFKVFDRTVKYLGTKVPESVRKALEPIKEDDAAVREYGIKLAEEMSIDLLKRGAPGVHFFTLNLERTVAAVIERLGEKGALNTSKSQHREFPWKQSAHEKRAGETVRPIFWSNKPKSYVARTQAWDEFPNGRWGDASSPAYGELKGSHYYSAPYGRASERLGAWGASPLTVAEIAQIFANFVEGKVEYLPWSESGLALETGEIRTALVNMNRAGFLTINSQPRVNAAPSNDATFGWGPSDGYVYQKAYVEFFVCEAGARALFAALSRYPSLDLHAINHKGEELRRRRGESADGPCAVTWGVFPGREVLQPTIVDPVSFAAWKDEAFELWVEAWASIYPEDSPSHSLIWDIHDQFWLVNVVDNDFIAGDIFRIFQEPEVLKAAAEGLTLKGGF